MLQILLAHEDSLIRKGIARFLIDLGYEAVDIKYPRDIERYLDARPSFEVVIAGDHEVTREGRLALQRHHNDRRTQHFVLMSDEASPEEVSAFNGYFLRKRDMARLTALLDRLQPATVV